MPKSYSKQFSLYDSGLVLSSVEQLPTASTSVAFTVDSGKVFREDGEIVPVTLSNGIQYMPLGGDNLLPYHVLNMIESDETLSTCQIFNAEVCYGNGLQYNTEACTKQVKDEIQDFLLCNNMSTYFLGVCQDFKHFGWRVSVIILDNEGKHIIENVLYGNWKKSLSSVNDVEIIPFLSLDCPWHDLQDRLQRNTHLRKFAIVSRVPIPDSTYYPIPYYASLFKGKWYNISSSSVWRRKRS